MEGVLGGDIIAAVVEDGSLKIETSTDDDHVATLSVRVGAERVQRAMEAAARRIARRTKIPGFRAGKAPYSVVERRYGADAIFDEAMEALAGEVYPEGLSQAELAVIDKAEWEVAERDPVTFRFRAPLKPDVQLGDYERFRVAAEAIAVEEDAVQKVLEALQKEQGDWTPVDRPAADGDLIVLEGRGEAGGREVLSLNGVEYGLQVGSGSPVEGFPEMLEGMDIGETRSFDLTYPMGHPDPGLAGRTVEFEITLRGVKELVLPPLDDALARSTGDFESLAELRDRVREVLEGEAEAAERERVADLVLSAIVKESEIRYPQVLLEREIDSAEEEYAQLLTQRGFTLERYLEVTGKTRESLRHELRPGAERRLNRGLVLAEISHREGISVEEEETEAEVEAIARGYGDQAEAVAKALTSGEPNRAIRSRLFGRKVLDRLAEIGRSEEAGETVAASEDSSEASSDEASPILTPSDLRTASE